MLNKQQQKVFLGFADQLIKADKIISKDEARLMEGFKAELGHNETETNLSEENVKNMFPNKQTKAILMLELLGIAICDGKISVEEKELLEKVKQVFSISEEEMKKYSEWVMSLNDLYKTASDLIN